MTDKDTKKAANPVTVLTPDSVMLTTRVEMDRESVCDVAIAEAEGRLQANFDQAMALSRTSQQQLAEAGQGLTAACQVVADNFVKASSRAVQQLEALWGAKLAVTTTADLHEESRQVKVKGKGLAEAAGLTVHVQAHIAVQGVGSYSLRLEKRLPATPAVVRSYAAFQAATVAHDAAMAEVTRWQQARSRMPQLIRQIRGQLAAYCLQNSEQGAALLARMQTVAEQQVQRLAAPVISA